MGAKVPYGAITFAFFVGAAVGIYISQNYAVPDLRYWVENGLLRNIRGRNRGEEEASKDTEEEREQEDEEDAKSKVKGRRFSFGRPKIRSASASFQGGRSRRSICLVR